MIFWATNYKAGYPSLHLLQVYKLKISWELRKMQDYSVRQLEHRKVAGSIQSVHL